MQTHFRHLRPRAFQWYKERLNPLSFDPYNCFLKIWESIVMKFDSIRIFFSFVTIWDMEIVKVDIKRTILYGGIFEKLYMD